MNETLKTLFGDLKTAVATAEKLDLETLPGLVGARLLLAIEKTRCDLLKAVDAATAAAPDSKTKTPLFKK